MGYQRRTAPRGNDGQQRQRPANRERRGGGIGGMLGNAIQMASGKVETSGTREPSRPSGGTRDGGTFTGPTSDMGPTVHLPDHLMPFAPSTMFA